jgi:DNA-binding HxlR family transcriptional regulator
MRLHPPLDDRDAWSPVGHCPIEKAMAVVGSRPAMLIMREAHYGTRRFDDFVTRVGLAPATASTHLRALTDAGLLERRPYQDDGSRTREEYALTPAGADLVPVVMGLFAWGARHTEDADRLELAHHGCAEPAAVRVVCAAGHEVPDDELELRVRRRRRARD